MKIILAPLSLLLLAPHAFADTKLVAEITTGTDTSKRTITVQFHGNKDRRDASNGSIVLMDRDAKKVWVLNPTDNTY
ncbi:hypothetical protein [Armatimonas sp.]|uniref:hypothetical protein n=1 Tax=Armatimonas sp. TaxID=1872638 RepID=UPI00286A13FE|nr:hypothetical protein [Armatimonas sp.]